LWQIFPDNTVMEIDFAQLTIVPEPSGLALSLVGVSFLVGWRRKKPER
jgi:hypothetical protein